LGNRTAAVVALVIAVMTFPLFRWHQHADHIADLQAQYAAAGSVVDSFRSTLDALASARGDFAKSVAGATGAVTSSAQMNVVAGAGAVGGAIDDARSRAGAVDDALSALLQQLPAPAIAAERPQLDRLAGDRAAVKAALDAAAANATRLAQDPFTPLAARDSSERSLQNTVIATARTLDGDLGSVLAGLHGAEQAAEAQRDGTGVELRRTIAAPVLQVLLSP
jgi:hypothetical protein